MTLASDKIKDLIMGKDSTASSLDSSDYSGSTSSSSDSSSNSSSSSSSSSSSDSSSSSGIFDKNCRCVHLDKAWCPGTTKLRVMCRQVAIENDCQTFSKKISKQILKRMEGMRFFRPNENKDDSSDSDSSDSDGSDSDSSDSDISDESSDTNTDSRDSDDDEGEYGFGCYTVKDEIDIDDEDDMKEISTKKLEEAIRPFYDSERFMIQNQAHCRDVYFKHPNHPGTQSFVRASQQLVIRLGVARNFDERTYHKMLMLLHDSKFFVGKAPKCVEANEEDCICIFRARYEFDRKMIRKIISESRVRRPIPGTVCIKCSCCGKRDAGKKNCVVKLLDFLPKTLGIPLLIIISFFSFGFLYFFIWYIFKVMITTVYVLLGVSISFLMGDDDDNVETPEEEEGIKDSIFNETMVNETMEEVVENIERNLTLYW